VQGLRFTALLDGGLGFGDGGLEGGAEGLVFGFLEREGGDGGV